MTVEREGRKVNGWINRRQVRRLKFGPASSPSSTCLENGIEHLSNGLIKDATEEFGKAIRLDPKSAKAFELRAFCHAVQEDWKNAVADTTVALRLDSSCDSAHMIRANCYVKLYKLDPAIADCDHVLQRKPGFFSAYVVRGQAYCLKGDLDRAIKDWTRAISGNAEDDATDRVSFLPTAYYLRGVAYFEKNEYVKAATDLTRAVDSARADALRYEAYVARATVFRTGRVFDPAIADLHKAIRLRPKAHKAYAERAMIHQQNGDIEDALADWNEVIRIRPDNWMAYANRGVIHSQQGEMEAALSDLNQAAQLDPTQAEVFLNRGRIHMHLGQLDKAMADLNESIRLDPKDVRVFFARAGCHLRKKGKAREAASKGGEFSLANLSVGKDSDEAAIRDLTRAIELDPRMAEAYKLRAHTYSSIVFASVFRGDGQHTEAIRAERWGEGTAFPSIWAIRQLAFEQDHTYNPTVTPDGRILYLRWDYTDTPHVWNRVLFTMNPDGTNQTEYYAANSYWPNSVFHTRQIPEHPTKFVGIVTGHHVGRAGEMILFDRGKGLQETEGVVQRIGDRHGRVEPLIEDKLTQHSWPKFLHPYPLSDKYFLVSCKPTAESLWGVYLVDVFDNFVLLKEQEGRALLEPIPLRSTPRPPVIADQTDSDAEEGTVFLVDIYAGPGLGGIPRGTVKKLRVSTYHFAYQKQAGINHRIGADGPWEVTRVLGTVPVAEDGSAFFRVPAKTPISLQPLDEEGKALQLMRSRLTVMPGETRSCVGCHENTSEVSPAVMPNSLAGLRRPAQITPWYGPVRGFSFTREVQPVLNKFCVSCHDGSPQPDGTEICDLRAEQNAVWAYRHGNPDLVLCRDTPWEKVAERYNGLFPPSYVALRKQVRVGGLESDLHLLPPMEFHADTSRLIQMLRKGHHGVELNAEAWDRLIKRHFVTEGLANQGNNLLRSPNRTHRVQVFCHEHKRTDLDFDSLRLALLHGCLDQRHRLLHGFLTPFGRLIDRHMRVVDRADQLTDGLACDAPHHVQDGELDGGQRNANPQSAQSEVECIYEGFVQKLIQPPRVLANEHWLHTFDKDRIQHAHRIVRDGNPFRTIFGPHPTQIGSSIAQ